MFINAASNKSSGFIVMKEGPGDAHFDQGPEVTTERVNNKASIDACVKFRG